jgi:hypothetical protein
MEFDQWLRSEYKYNGKEEMYAVREKLNQIINDNNVKLLKEKTMAIILMLIIYGLNNTRYV